MHLRQQDLDDPHSPNVGSDLSRIIPADSILPQAVVRAIRAEAFRAWRHLGRYGYGRNDIGQELTLHWIRRHRQYDPQRSSPSTFASRICRRRGLQLIETATAHKRGAATVSLSDPIGVRDDGDGGGMDYLLGSRHWLDAMTPPLENHLRTLADRIRDHLGPQSHPLASKPDRSSDLDARACHERAIAHYHRQEFVEAIAELTHSIEIDPTVAWAFNDRGGAHLNLGQLELAVSDLTRGLELDSSPAWAWHMRACAFSRLNRKKAAIEDFTQAIHRDASVAWFFHDRGAAYLELGDANQAVDDLSQALVLNPALEWAYRNRAAAYEKLGHHELAQCDWEAADKVGGTT